MKNRSSYLMGLIDSYSDAVAPRGPASLSDQDLEHLYGIGLASIALVRLGPKLDELSDESRLLLRSADLTARVVYGQIRDTTGEVLDTALRHDIPVVLLKGISIAEDLYDEPHHRLMGDVDVLVSVEQANDLYELLDELGYSSPNGAQKPTLPDGHHHLEETCQPDSGISVEIHTSLFSATPMSDEHLFQIPNIWKLTEPAEYFGVPCLRFRPELQLLYTVAHWAVDQKWARNVISINDVVLMLRRYDDRLDWRLIATWLPDNPLLANCLTVILTFFKDIGIMNIPATITHEIEGSARQIGAANMKLLHQLMLKFPLSNRRRSPSPVTILAVRIFWQAMLEPRHKLLRPIVSVTRIIFRKTRDKSILSSIPGRVRTFIRLMRQAQ